MAHVAFRFTHLGLALACAALISCAGAQSGGDAVSAPVSPTEPVATLTPTAQAAASPVEVTATATQPEPTTAPAAPTVAAATRPGTPIASVSAPLASAPQTRRADAMEVTLVVAPGRAGFNEVNFYFFDSEGAWASVEMAEVRFTYLDFDAGAVVEQTPPLHAGHVLIQGTHLRHAGRWRIDALFAGPELRDATVSFLVTVP